MDEVLLKNFNSGDDNAFALIYNKYVDVLLSYGIGLGFERELLKDAIQDVFVKLYSNRNHLFEVRNLKHYLFRSLKNRMLDIIKMSMDTNDIQDHEFKFQIKSNILDELIKEEDRVEIQNKVDNLLKCLTNRQREVIYLRFIQEMGYEDISELMGLTPHGTRKLVSRAMKRIKEENMLIYILFFLISHFNT